MNIYLKKFDLASASDEESFILNFPYQLEMQCYTKNVYPFKIFPQKRLSSLDFYPITIFYGGNGSGKSTLLNIIAEKLRVKRSAPFNNTPYFADYLRFCDYEIENMLGIRGAKFIASDDIFDYLLDIRAINEGVDRRREQLFEEYEEYTSSKNEPFYLRSLDDYDEFKRRNEAKRKTKSAYTTKRLPRELSGMSNGESAFAYFTHEIRENALYLLDEPENSLSPKLQTELAEFLESSTRFYGCQVVISTHSPFLLSMKGAKIYDLDAFPVTAKRWTELANVRAYYEFFKKHDGEF